MTCRATLLTDLGTDLDGRVLGHELGRDRHALVDGDARLGDSLVLVFFRGVGGGDGVEIKI